MELRRVRHAGLARTISERLSRLWALAALAALTALRLVVAASVPLAPDEAYYWVWSRALAPGYPDHPPMVALWIRGGTALAGDGALGIRLLGPLSVAAASLLAADAAERLFPGRDAGLRAAALLNATLLFGVGSVLMTPDAPLLAFWTACLWALARLLDSGDQRWWIAAGAFAGLAMDSKYTAALLCFGMVLWLLVTPSLRHRLRQPWPWLGGALAMALFLPVMLWEAQHGWPSFLRQGGRIAEWHPSRAVGFLAELVGGQMGLATPLVFALCVVAVVQATRLAWRTRDPAAALVAAMTLPAAALFIQHALGDRVQGNWPAVIYPAAAIGAGGLTPPRWRMLLATAIGLGLAMTLLVYLQAAMALLPLPPRYDPIARQLAGWRSLASEIEAVRRQSGASFVAADQYGLAGELALEAPREERLVSAEPRLALLALPSTALAGQVGLLVQGGGGAIEPRDPPWRALGQVATLERRRGDAPIEAFRVYRVVLAKDAAAAVLPRPN